MSSKWTIARRIVQASVLVLIASPLLGATFFQGNLAAAEIFGLTLADPLAFLQVITGSRIFVASYLGSALLVTAFYFILGGRSFCAWVCPVGLLSELGDKIRKRMGTGLATLPLSSSRWSLALVLLVTALTGIPLFEAVSPLGVVGRALVFASYLPLLLLAAILTVEILLARRIWCRSLCPLGGFYSLLARFSPVRVGFLNERCTHCGDCTAACPVEEVLAPSLEQGTRQVTAGDCTRCLACVDICPTKALKVDLFYH